MVAVEVATAAADVVTNGEHGTCERNVYAVNIEETNGEHTKCANEVFPQGNTSFMYNVHSPKLKHIVRAKWNNKEN